MNYFSILIRNVINKFYILILIFFNIEDCATQHSPLNWSFKFYAPNLLQMKPIREPLIDLVTITVS